MNVRAALKGQYHGGLAMLRQAISSCPEDLWTAGEHPRTFWRIAYHALFYTHLYMQPSEADFVAYEKHEDDMRLLWVQDGHVPASTPVLTREEVLAYLDVVDASVDSVVDSLDLNAQDCGFWWYDIPKLDHQLMNIRHLGYHAGQLSELLMARGVDVDWVGRSTN